MIKILYTSIILLASCSRELPQTIGSNSKAVAQNFSSTSDAAPAIDHATIQTITDGASPYFFKANYRVTVKALSMKVCDSEIQFAVSSKLGMDGSPVFVMDKHVITCMFGIKLDLIKILAGLAIKVSAGSGLNNYNTPGSPNAPSNADIQASIQNLNKVIVMKADKNAIYLDRVKFNPVINASYSPSRAFLPNIIGGEESELATYNVTQKITATDHVSNERSEGYIHLKMNEWKKSHKSNYLKDIPFDDTAFLTVSSRGFSQINTARAFIPKELKMRISRDPVAMISISAKIKMLDTLGLGQTKQQVMQTMQQAKAEGGIITNIVAMLIDDYCTININLIDQEGIRELLKPDKPRDTTDDL